MSIFRPTISWLFKNVFPRTGAIWSIYIEGLELVKKTSNFCKKDKIAERAVIQYLHKYSRGQISNFKFFCTAQEENLG